MPLDIFANIAQILGTAQNYGQLLTIISIGYVIYMLVKNQKGQNKIAGNHLHPIPEIVEVLHRIEAKMDAMVAKQDILIEKQDKVMEEVAYFKGRLNGRS